MALDTRHPQYSERAPDWDLMRDAYAGQRRVKERTFTYLPATSGMLADGARHRKGRGWDAYQAYLARALFPDLVAEAVRALVGVMHRKPPVIELPAALEPMREVATPRGESLETLLQRINEEQIVVGRVGLLGDVAASGARAGMPYLALYYGEDVINWDEGQRTEQGTLDLNLVVLRETSYERVADFEWELVEKYRVLVLGDPTEIEPAGGGAYRVGVFREQSTFSESGLVTPTIAGREALEIPFTFANAVDIVPEPDRPPLLGLANICMAIYRGEADYRQSLFMQGQDTLVVIGHSPDDGDVRVGASARIDIPTVGGDAKFIGVSSSGLSEQREALQNDRAEASQLSGQLLDSVSRQRESGDALTIRVAARTATLNRLAIAGAFALQDVLRKVARWAGADPEQVVVTPNLDFVDDSMTGEELAQWMGAKTMGAPISMSTIHRLMEERGATEMTLEEELDEIEAERALVEEQSAGSSSADGPEDDEEQSADEDEDEDEDGEPAPTG